MNILNSEMRQKIQRGIIDPIQECRYDLAVQAIPSMVAELYGQIPAGKRISCGRIFAIRTLSEYLFLSLKEPPLPRFSIAAELFLRSEDFRTRGVALGILSFIGLENYEPVLPYFAAAANDENWDVREMSQMFFKKLIQKYPAPMKDYLLKLAQSENPNLRRFVAETLRPVQENRWFYRDPNYPLSILGNLFQEAAAYPRTAVGNNLSDLARQLPELVYDLVQKLVESGDKNSYWIAYRACRNLVKRDPLRVMDLLKIDEYKYKKRVYKRSSYHTV